MCVYICRRTDYPYSIVHYSTIQTLNRAVFLRVTPGYQAHSQEGASVCNAPTTILDAPTRSRQNTKDKHADQSTKTRATPCDIHVLLLSNCRGAVLEHYVIKMLICGTDKGAFYARLCLQNICIYTHTHICTRFICVLEHYIRM